jgi:hypothetical protein
MRVLVAVLTLVIFSCSDKSVTPPTPLPIRTTEPYVLLTHCGIEYTRFEGRWYYADPPNPAGRWPNPEDAGTITVVDNDTIVFTDPAGNRARFTTHPSYPTPSIAGCD